MIIIGYPGIGKTTISHSENNNGYIDLESSCFYVNKKRPKDWYKYYCNLAYDLSSQGNDVFVSSHAEVRKYLKEKFNDDRIICVHPSKELKDEWIKKLEDRYKENQTTKNYKAWINASFYYLENIEDMQASGFPCLEIEKIPYNLEYLLNDFILSLEVEKFKKVGN